MTTFVRTECKHVRLKSKAVRKKYALITCVNRKEDEKKKDNTQSFEDT